MDGPIASSLLYQARLVLLVNPSVLSETLKSLADSAQKEVLTKLLQWVCGSECSTNVKGRAATNLLCVANDAGLLNTICSVACTKDPNYAPDYTDLVAHASTDSARSFLMELESTGRIDTWFTSNVRLANVVTYCEESFGLEYLDKLGRCCQTNTNVLARLFANLFNGAHTALRILVQRGHVEASKAFGRLVAKHLPNASGTVTSEGHDLSSYATMMNQRDADYFPNLGIEINTTPRRAGLLVGEVFNPTSRTHLNIYQLAKLQGGDSLRALFAFCDGEKGCEDILMALARKDTTEFIPPESSYEQFKEQCLAETGPPLSKRTNTSPRLAMPELSTATSRVDLMLEYLSKLEGSEPFLRRFKWKDRLLAVAETESEQLRFLQEGVRWINDSLCRSVRYHHFDSVKHGTSKFPARTLFSFEIPRGTEHLREWRKLINEHPRAVRYFQYADEIEPMLASNGQAFPRSLVELETFLLAQSKELLFADTEHSVEKVSTAISRSTIPCTLSIMVDVDQKIMPMLHHASLNSRVDNSGLMVEEGRQNTVQSFAERIFVHTETGQIVRRPAGIITDGESAEYLARVDQILQEKDLWRIYRGRQTWSLSVDSDADLMTLRDVSQMFAQIEKKGFIFAHAKGRHQHITFDLSSLTEEQRLLHLKRLMTSLAYTSRTPSFSLGGVYTLKDSLIGSIRAAPSIKALSLLCPSDWNLEITSNPESNTCRVTFEFMLGVGDLTAYKPAQLLLAYREALTHGVPGENGLDDNLLKTS
jgi:hypothetical protein